MTSNSAGQITATGRPDVSVIIPVLNEQNSLGQAVRRIARCCAGAREVIFVDGGSTDGTLETLARTADGYGDAPRMLVESSPPGRAIQMNKGASLASGDILLFLHVDTCLPDHALQKIQEMIRNGVFWGRFDVSLDSDKAVFRMIGLMMNLRSALTGIATGDQAIFVRRDVFAMLGGYSAIPLMEDIDCCRRLKTVAPPGLIHDPVTTSARRWQRSGIFRTILLMWMLRLAFWLGIPPHRLVRLYSNVR